MKNFLPEGFNKLQLSFFTGYFTAEKAPISQIAAVLTLWHVWSLTNKSQSWSSWLLVCNTFGNHGISIAQGNNSKWFCHYFVPQLWLMACGVFFLADERSDYANWEISIYKKTFIIFHLNILNWSCLYFSNWNTLLKKQKPIMSYPICG